MSVNVETLCGERWRKDFILLGVERWMLEGQKCWFGRVRGVRRQGCGGKIMLIESLTSKVRREVRH